MLWWSEHKSQHFPSVLKDWLHHLSSILLASLTQPTLIQCGLTIGTFYCVTRYHLEAARSKSRAVRFQCDDRIPLVCIDLYTENSKICHSYSKYGVLELYTIRGVTHSVNFHILYGILPVMSPSFQFMHIREWHWFEFTVLVPLFSIYSPLTPLKIGTF